MPGLFSTIDSGVITAHYQVFICGVGVAKQSGQSLDGMDDRYLKKNYITSDALYVCHIYVSQSCLEMLDYLTINPLSFTV